MGNVLYSGVGQAKGATPLPTIKVGSLLQLQSPFHQVKERDSEPKCQL